MDKKTYDSLPEDERPEKGDLVIISLFSKSDTPILIQNIVIEIFEVNYSGVSSMFAKTKPVEIKCPFFDIGLCSNSHFFSLGTSLDLITVFLKHDEMDGLHYSD